MRQFVHALTIVSCATILYARAADAQVEEVREAMIASLAAWNRGDVEAFGGFFSAQTRGFNLDGGLLLRGFNPQALQIAISAGFSINVEPRDIDIKIYGGTAVAVAYLDGSITLPGGTAQQGTWRYSETRINDAGRWKVVQYHVSAMTVPAGGPPPE
jgi:ketosteroid isomerase-like protein